MNPFVHLHVHTQYSLLDGAIRLEALFNQVKSFGMNAVAITDHGTMFGVVDFYEQAKKSGIKPILGCECYVAPRTLHHKNPMDKKGVRHLLLLAENQKGYKNLCKLASIAQLDGFYYKPRIDKIILEEYSEGLIALSACLKGEVAQHILDGHIEKADESARYYQRLFGENNFFLEVQNNGIAAQEKVNEALLDMSRRLSIPLVATNDCHYLRKEDAKAHEILLCVQTGKTVHDSNRFQFESDQLYLKSPEEMEKYFISYPGALQNTVDIANRCHVEFDFSSYHFPQFDSESGKTVNEIFDEKVNEGFLNRLQVLERKNPELQMEAYKERLTYEADTIKNMGFPGYFLIVADFIEYAKNNRIPVGPGRGSAAGSLVSYALGITDLDPIEHGLIFERFLNPARISMPDIDVDFCINGREQVFKYVVDRYGGGDYVAQIITYGKMKARAVIRDVGRALGIPLSNVDTIAKLIPDDLKITIKKALDAEPRLLEKVKSDPSIAELIEVSSALEGLPRHASTHAAGVVIGDRPLSDYLPLYKGKRGEVTTQFDMKIVEKIGLVKFDFLGLRNLTVIDQTLQLIEQQKKVLPDLANLPFDDERTYEILKAGDTTGVFQLESSGMKDLLIRLHPKSFQDLTALVALYRPGPLDSGMVDDFVERRHGRKKVEYMVPALKSILEETYGVMVYQEQVMQVAGALSSYSMADADSLRKAIGKKNESLMAEHREKFVNGAASNGVEREKAIEIFDLIEKFGGYGFNKSHSAAYALISYQTAYLKAHFPVEFMAALLTSEMRSIDGVIKFINECKNHTIEILPPDINESQSVFTVINGKIRFGLAAVKNVGEAAIDLIIKERERCGRFKSIFDFCERVDLQKANKRVIESLIFCGAFDSTGEYRSRMVAVLEEALDFGQKVQKEKRNPQMSLFEIADCNMNNSINPPKIPMIDEWDQADRLQHEKEYLGFYITGHPLDRYSSIIRKYSNANALSLIDEPNNRTVRIAGNIKAIKTIRTKKNDLMAFISLEDLSGLTEVIVFPSVFKDSEHLLKEDVPVFVQGKLQLEEKSVKILADSIIFIEDAESNWTVSVHFNVDVTKSDAKKLMELKSVIDRYPGGCDGYIHLLCPEQFEAVIAIAEKNKVNPSSDMIREVIQLMGDNCVNTTCSHV